MNSNIQPQIFLQAYQVPTPFVFVPYFAPQMYQAFEVVSDVPKASTFCGCDGLETQKQTQDTPFGKSFSCGSTNGSLAMAQTPESPGPLEAPAAPVKSKYKFKKADLPRRHKKESKIFERLKTRGEDLSILKEIEDLTNLDDYVIKPTAKADNPKSRLTRMRSKYIGVSHKNGTFNSYIVIDGKKTYICGTTCEEKSARYYDYIAILYHGKAATTNFKYTLRDLILMLTEGKVWTPPQIS